MTFTGELANLNGNTILRLDDAAGDLVPASGNVPADLVRGLGMFLGPGSTAAAPVKGRSFINETLPPGLAIVQTAIGAEKNTFTTRVAVNGTLLNTMKIGGTQVNGTFPAGALNLVGRTLRIVAFGDLGATSTPTYTFDIGLGTGVLVTSGAQTMVASTTPASFLLTAYATVLASGSSGTLISGGTFVMANASNAATSTWTLGNSTVGTPLTADLTTALAFTFNMTSGTSDAANRIRCRGLLAEILN